MLVFIIIVVCGFSLLVVKFRFDCVIVLFVVISVNCEVWLSMDNWCLGKCVVGLKFFGICVVMCMCKLVVCL